ncbi:MAG TPA: hypothetical protein VJK54_01120, partial [Chthoniobacterales bacterium]|nr:hypothetical protein [Chthoniobacterales bacterium]
MKKLLYFITVILTAHCLLGQISSLSEEGTGKNRLKAEGYRLKGAERTFSNNTTTNYEPPTANCNNQGHHLDCYLMMNPSLTEGAKAVEEIVTVQNSRNFFKNREAAIKASGAARAPAPDAKQAICPAVKWAPVNPSTTRTTIPVQIAVESSVSVVSDSTTEANNNISATSQHITVFSNIPSTIGDIVSFEENNEEVMDVNKYLEDEVCSNIYTKCFAKVATMTMNQSSIGKSIFSENAQEAEVWEAAKVLADAELRRAERALAKATRETEEAKAAIKDDPNKEYANAFYQFKKMEEQLIEAKVMIADNTVTALGVKNVPSMRDQAEKDLEEAKEEKNKALVAYNEAKEQFEKIAVSPGKVSSSSNQAEEKGVRKNMRLLLPNISNSNDVGKLYSNKNAKNLRLKRLALKEKEKLNTEKAELVIEEDTLAKNKKGLESAEEIVSPQEKEVLSQKLSALQKEQEALAQKREVLTKKEAELKALETFLQEKEVTFTQALELEKAKLAQTAMDLDTREKVLQEKEAAEKALETVFKGAELDGDQPLVQEIGTAYESVKMPYIDTQKITEDIEAIFQAQKSNLPLSQEVKGIDPEKYLLRIEAYRKLIEALKKMQEGMKNKKTGANSAGVKDAGKSWGEASNSFYLAVGKLEKAINAETDGKAEVAQKWSEAAEQQARSAKYYTKAAEAYAAGKKDEGVRWHDVGVSFYESSGKLGKAIEKEINRSNLSAEELKKEVAILQKEAKECKQEADQKLKAVEAKIDENKSEYAC